MEKAATGCYDDDDMLSSVTKRESTFVPSNLSISNSVFFPERLHKNRGIIFFAQKIMLQRLNVGGNYY